MKVSINWLKDYIDLDGISVDEIVDKITNAGLEVDEVIDGNKIYENFVVGYVLESGKHPNADKLSVCKVSDGNETYKVVCGAPNVAAGQKVAFAKVGAVIPGAGFKIKKAKIRGEESFGMICAEDELGISDDHEGIMVLDENLSEGTPLSEALGLNDVTLEIAITPNRADALSHIGIARDLAALFKREVKYPEIKLNESEKPIEEIAAVEIENAVDCPRYLAKVVEGVTVKESPEWLKKKLTSIGLRPINNVVDVTNYVLHEIGQPLHGFDLDKLAGNKIVVKSAGEIKKFTTLDSKERELLSTDLMICDAEKPVAVAGVMGGENSEVTDETKNVLIESAYFRPSAIRKTAKHLGLQTDASYRFERGCNPDIVKFAAERAAQLIAELGGGKIAKGTIDVYPNEIEKKKISLRYKRVNKILGFEISNEEIKETFPKLGFNIVAETEEGFTVEVPLFRPDVEREIDLIEEVIRIYGFDKIPNVPKIEVALEAKTDAYSFADKVRETLTGFGFNEIITNSLWNKEIAEKFGNAIGVMNPQNVEMSHTRPSLLPGALSTIARNIKVKENNLRLFEIGRVFRKKSDVIKTFEDFEETDELLIVLSGNATEKTWHSSERKFDFFDVKGLAADFIFAMFKIDISDKNFIRVENEKFSSCFEIKINGKSIGRMGKLDEEISGGFGISQNVFAIELNMENLQAVKKKNVRYNELLKYPKIVRDFAFLLDKSINVGDVEKEIKSSGSNLLKNIKLFDIFESDSIGKDKKSLAFELEYYDFNKTLTDEEVDKEFWKAIENVKKKFNAQLRG